MERDEIIKLSKKIKTEDLEEAKNNLEKNYEISYGKYSEQELIKALEEKKPILIKNHFLIGHENKTFIDINENKIPIERMVKAVIIEEIKPAEDNRDPFVILGQNEWEDISDFNSIIGKLKVGEIFLPPHSAIFHFLKASPEIKKEKIVSSLEGINIKIYGIENYVDNAIHEIGHLFWRDCLVIEEKEAFKDFFHMLKPSALYDYKWERETEEAVFCTIYKWYIKSLLLNSAFYNILEHEEPTGLKLFQDILSRIARDRQISDIFNMNKQDFLDYLKPKYDITTKKKLRKAGMYEKIKDIEIPADVLKNVDRLENGIEYITLAKGVTVPVKENKVYWEKMDG